MGSGPHSLLARENLQRICAEHLRANACTVKIVDVEQDFQEALNYSILVTPTLVVEGPRGRSTIIGNLSEVDRVLLTLGPD